MSSIKDAISACLHALKKILSSFNRTDARGVKRVSHATARARTEVLTQGFRDLFRLGFKIRNPENFSPRHMRALVREWEAKGLAASTLQWRFSVFSTFCNWIGKSGMIGNLADHLLDPARARRTYVIKEKKTWTQKGIDIAAKLLAVAADDIHAAIQLLAMWTFGLRAQEAWLLKPLLADQGAYLAVNWGTKGGRHRTVTIRSAAERLVLDLIKGYADPTTGSLIPARYSLRAWKSHFYRVCREHGISRQDGIVPHGLRHELANEVYEKLCKELAEKYKHPSPETDVGQAQEDNEDLARRIVTETLGHSRPEITSCYLGPKPRRKKKKGKKPNRGPRK